MRDHPDGPSHAGFSDVDRDPLAPMMVQYVLTAERRQDMTAMRALAARMASPPAGGAALDVGCGAGGAVLELARAVGASGAAIGLDASEEMIAAARARADGLPGVRFERGDAAALPFPDDELDLVRSERLLQHVPDADAVVREMVRVCRPGGQVLLLDTDWGSAACEGVDPELVAAVFAVPLALSAHPRSGVELRGRLVRAGCDDVRVAPWTFVMTTAQDAAGLVIPFRRDLPAGFPVLPDALRPDWYAAVDAADAAGELLVAFTAWVAAGRKPVGARR